MKKKFLYTALFALMLAACSEQELTEQPSTPIGCTRKKEVFASLFCWFTAD